MGSKEQAPGLLRLQKDIARDKLRLQQRLEAVDGEPVLDEAPDRRSTGRLYEVFVAMGEA